MKPFLCRLICHIKSESVYQNNISKIKIEETIWGNIEHIGFSCVLPPPIEQRKQVFFVTFGCYCYSLFKILRNKIQQDLTKKKQTGHCNQV